MKKVKKLRRGVKELIKSRKGAIKRCKKDGESSVYWEGELAMLKWMKKVLDDE